MSRDGGAAGSWKSLTAGAGAIHESSVTDVEVDAPEHPALGLRHQAGRYLYVATYGHGWWLYDFGSGTLADTSCSTL